MSADVPPGGLDCAEVLALLPSVLDGSLAPALQDPLHTHLSTCPACARFGSSYQRVVTALRQLSAPSFPEPDLLAAINDRL